jgi:SAM-dependent methyltransferase
MINTPAEYQIMYQTETELWWYKALHHRVLEAITKAFGQNRNIKILDAGCGTGGLLFFLQKNGYHNIQGIDHSPDAVKYTQSRGLHVQQQNLNSFTFDQTFDVIICNDALCYLNDGQIKTCLEKFSNLLNTNGLLISNNNSFDIFWGTHDIAIDSHRRFRWSYFAGMSQQLPVQVLGFSYWSLVLSPLVLAIRLSQRLRHYLAPKSHYLSDVRMPARWLNNFFYNIVKTEASLLPRQPFGSSLFWVFKKK